MPQVPVELVGLLLGVVRAAAWLLLAPPFNTRMVPRSAKGLLAVALTLPVADDLARVVPDLTLPGFIGAVVVQVATGAALGFTTQLLFAAVQAAGDLIDLFGGFTVAFGYDPLSMSQSSVFGRLHQLLAVVLLFTTGGHLVIVQGFLQSYESIPVTSGVALDRLAATLTGGVGTFFLSALAIAAPLIGVLFVADVGLGLLTRVSPSLNAFSLGFPIKILLTLVVIGFTFPLLPGVVDSVVDEAYAAVGGLGG
ncbi:flagellar biosynthetic protein FliR [Vallicoccus soli]|uniref:Flagellar biosynthetic protein FliR n=1 Tax=Vallicoccus soli TaxID=2339232 RepID=A0A3A3YQA6_9ACTN|nr:flagellar biosynthetic protein FliR [Vallicoccus soli]RJK92801.1 flagellar biosynthetic protein FliR [Vallicoccus soli]